MYQSAIIILPATRWRGGGKEVSHARLASPLHGSLPSHVGDGVTGIGNPNDRHIHQLFLYWKSHERLNTSEASLVGCSRK